MTERELPDLSPRIEHEGVNAAFLESHSGFLRKLAREIVRDPHAAEDLVQDTLLTAMEHPPQGAITSGGWRAWLATVLRHRAERKSREMDARRRREREVARSEATYPAHGQDEDHAQLKSRLARAVVGLEEPYRSAVILRWLQGKSLREVAAIQGVSYAAARQRLSRATTMLRVRLDRDYGNRARWSGMLLIVSRSGSDDWKRLFQKSWSRSSGVALVAGMAAFLVFFGLARRPELVRGEFLEIATADPAISPVDSTRAAIDDLSGAREQRRALAESHDRAAAAFDDRETLHGIVLDASGAPRAGADVRLMRDPNAGFEDLEGYISSADRAQPTLIEHLKTDDAGRFSIHIPAGVPFALDVSSSGLASTWIPHRFAGEHVVVRLSQGANIQGVVSRASDGSPVVDAIVRGLRPHQNNRMRDTRPVFEARTDASGRYRAQGVAPGTFMVQCLPPGDASPPWREVTLAESMTESVDFRVQPAIAITGRIVDASTGRGIPDAVVGFGWTLDSAARTDENGSFRIVNPPRAGRQVIQARAPGYASAMTRPPPRGAESPEWSVDLELVRGWTLRGRVRGPEGSALSNARIVVMGSRGTSLDQEVDARSTTSTADGRFELADLRHDLTYVLAVSAEGHARVLRDLPACSVKEMELKELTLERGAMLRGRVVDGEGKGLADQLVRLHGPHLPAAEWWQPCSSRAATQIRPAEQWVYLNLDHVGARSDADGYFAFAHVASGAHSLSARARGGAAPVIEAVPEDLGAGRGGVVLVLEEGLRIAGSVVDETGRALAGARVLVQAADSERADFVVTDADGRFETSGWLAGPHRVEVTQGRCGRGTVLAHGERLDVEGGRTDVVVVLRAGRVVRGVVRGADGEAKSRTGVGFAGSREGYGRFEVLTDHGGRFSIVVPVGEGCFLTAASRGGEGAGESAPVWVDGEVSEVEIRVRE